MARTERTTVKYAVQVDYADAAGAAELDARTGEPYEAYRNGDEPWGYVIMEVTQLEVHTGRGKDWQASGETRKPIAKLTPEQLNDLIRSGSESLFLAADTHNRNLRIRENLKETVDAG